MIVIRSVLTLMDHTIAAVMWDLHQQQTVYLVQVNNNYGVISLVIRNGITSYGIQLVLAAYVLTHYVLVATSVFMLNVCSQLQCYCSYLADDPCTMDNCSEGCAIISEKETCYCTPGYQLDIMDNITCIGMIL